MLVINEFNKHLPSKGLLIQFRREGDKIIIIDSTSSEGMKTLWDVYTNQEETETILNSTASSITQKYCQETLSKFKQKFHSRIESAATHKERINIIKEMMEYIEEEKRRIDKNMFEETDEHE